MPIDQIVQMMIAERDRLNSAIETLTGASTKPRRGRPPKDASLANAPSWVTGQPEKPPRKKRKFSAKQRAEQSKRAKAMWKKRKAAAKV
jgi:hypothetical protein